MQSNPSSSVTSVATAATAAALPSSGLADDTAAVHGKRLWSLSLAALGIVYGDIGTSPLYALRECFYGGHSVAVTPANVLGVLSLIFWALMLLISVKYLLYVMRADNRGEGGILALMALAQQRPMGPRWHKVVFALGLFGAALLYGDSMLTPSISVLSAVEGLELAAPQFAQYVVPVTIVLLVTLFSAQKRGTAGLGIVFGPVMVLWFTCIGVLGLVHVVRTPAVWAAVNPWYGLAFLVEHGGAGFLVLGAVFLCVTGGEALYADMGHFGRRPIQLGWAVVAGPALVCNYFGQGALLLTDPAAANNPFYNLAPSWALYPLLVLATCATIIASQAVISGAFSLTRQATMLGLLPRTHVMHTSSHEIGQVYVPAINRALLVCTVLLVLGFRSSGNLAAAYGIAVTTTMVITTLLAFVVARGQWGWSMWSAVAVTLIFLVIDVSFLGANLTKVQNGGWFPLLVALIFFVLMSTWKKGRALLQACMRENSVDLDEFYDLMHVERPLRVPGTAVYMTGTGDGTPAALIQNFVHNRVVHANNILLTVVTEETPRVAEQERLSVRVLREGFVRVTARYGFMERPNVPDVLARGNVPSYDLLNSTFFLGSETLLAEGGGAPMMRWRKRLFALLARNGQRATAFFGIPPDRVIEIGAQIKF